MTSELSEEVVVAMIRDIEFHLEGAATPSGEIAAKDIVAIVSALQELVTRVSRDVVASTGPGRTARHMEEFAQVRVSGIRPGSTVLEFHKGPTDTLDVEVPVYVAADRRLWEVFTGISMNRRREDLSDRIAETAGRLVEALQGTAPRILIRSESESEIRINSGALRLETWIARPRRTGATAAMAGWLEKVDLHSHELRVRDDVGNAVELRRVRDDVAAARLIGTWVESRGDAIEAPDGRLVALDNARVDKVTDPASEFVSHGVPGVDEILASAPGPDPGGGIDLTDDEFQAFLRAARS